MKTRDQIAAAMNLTPDQIRQIEEKALKKALPRLAALLGVPDARIVDLIALLRRSGE